MNDSPSFKARVTCSGRYLRDFPTCQTDDTCRSAAQVLDHVLTLGSPLNPKYPGMECLFKHTPCGYEVYLVDHDRLEGNCLAFEHDYLGAFIPEKVAVARFLLQPNPQIKPEATFQAQLLSVPDNTALKFKTREGQFIYHKTEPHLKSVERTCFSLNGTEPAIFDFEITAIVD